MIKKKRWWPKIGEIFWFITSDGPIGSLRWEKDEGCCQIFKKRSWKFTGVYRTKKEATLMRNKIKALVEKELGE